MEYPTTSEIDSAIFTVRTELGPLEEITNESVNRFSGVVDSLLGGHDQSLCEYVSLPLEAFPEDLKIRFPIARNEWLSKEQFSLLSPTEMVYYISLIPGEWMISDERASIPFETRWTLIENVTRNSTDRVVRDRLYDLAYFVYYGQARTPFLPDVVSKDDVSAPNQFIPDFDFSMNRVANAVITENDIVQLHLIEQELRLPMFSRYSKFEMSYHRLVQGVVFMADELIRCETRPREYYLPVVYRIRELFDDHTDYGLKSTLAEAQDEPGFFANMFEKIKELGRQTYKSAADVVGIIADKFRSMVSGWLSVIGDAFTRAFDWIVARVAGVVVKMFNETNEYFKDACKSFSSMVYLLGSWICFALVLDSFRILAFKVVPALLKHFARPSDRASTQSAQLASAVFNMVGSDASVESAVKRSEKLIKIAAGGGIIMSSSMALFALFPLYLREAILCRFGTASMRASYELNRWLQKVTAVTTLAKTSRVLVSASFNRWVTDLMAKAEKLKNKLVDLRQASLFLRKYAELSQIYANLHNFTHANISRPLPYSIHLCGQPGVGKTYLSSALMSSVFSVMPNQIYAVPKSGEFWSGFNAGHIGIIMDEFLIGDPVQVKNSAMTYLDLIGTNTFYPNLADIKDPIVGIKGTPAAPRVVMTMNNAAYFSVSGIPDSALNRRRNVVVLIEIIPDSPFYNHESKTPRIDAILNAGLSVENMPWARFKLLPNIAGSAPSAHGSMDLTELLSVLESNYGNFRTMSDNMNRSDDSETKTPDEMFDEIIKSLNGLDSEPMGVLDALGRLGTSIFKSESSSEAQNEPEAEAQDEDTFEAARLEMLAMNPIVPCDGVIELWAGLRMKIPEDQRMDVKVIRDSISRHAPISKKLRREFRKVVNGIFEVYYKAAYRYSTASLEHDIGRLIESAVNMYPINWFCNAIGFAFWLCEVDLENLPVVAQQDVIATMDMRNVSPKIRSRRACTTCGKQTVQEPGTRTLYLECSDCKSDNSTYYSTSDPTANVYVPTIPSRIGTIFLTPEERSLQYSEWFKAVCNKFLCTRVMPLIYGFADPRCTWLKEDTADLKAEPTPANLFAFEKKWHHRISTNEAAPWFWAAGWIAFAFGVRYAAKKLLPREEESQEWSAPARHTSQRSVRGPRQYVRGFAQSALSHMSLSVGTSVGKCIPVSPDVVLSFYHLMISNEGTERSADTQVSITVDGIVHTYALSDCEYVSDATNDVIFLRIPKKDRNNKVRGNFSSVAKKFWTLEQCDSYLGGPVCLMTERSTDLLTATVTKNEAYAKSFRGGTRRFELPYAVKYTAETMKGDCGAALVSNSPGTAGSIMGIHVAGGKGFGFGGSYGISTMVTKEDIESALEALAVETIAVAQNDELPNLEEIWTIDPSEKIHLSRRSKLAQSAIVPFVPWIPAKRMPILSSSDARSKGRDPVLSMVEDTLGTYNTTKPKVDVASIYDEMADFYVPLTSETKLRHLSFEEAVRGVPGLLSSIRSSTSAGYPLCLNPGSRGKQQFIKFVDGELTYPASFRKYCEDAYASYMAGSLDANRFVVYLKDEPISERKEREGRCRLIYCSDLVSNIVFRMVFGSLLLRFNNLHSKSPLCIGINQYSWDMEMLYQQCKHISTSFIAGDFKNFDKRVHPVFLTENFKFLMRLAGDLATDRMKELFINHQKSAPFQVLDLLIKPRATHYSGCFFTTPFNCFLVEAYMRYAFKRLCPGMTFNAKIGLQVMGDDHVMAVSDDIHGKFNLVTIADTLSEIGQVYTSDVKDAALDESFRTFDQITFLGATPRMHNGKWCGAFLKPSLEETLLWTRNGNRSLLNEVRTAFELSSIHGKEYYLWFTSAINHALQEANFPVVHVDSWTSVANSVAERTCTSGFDFPHAQSGDLVNINASDTKVGGIPGSGSVAIREKALTARHQELTFGLTSNILRTSFDWAVSDPLDTVLFDVAAPFGILSLGDPDNVQNIGFDRYTFMSADVVLTFQINGNRFLAGLIAAYFMPLAGPDYEAEYANVLATPHVLIEPSHNGTYELRIPYRYVRAALNTYNRTDETLGHVFVTVMSPLQSVNNEVVSVSVFSRFDNCYLSVPRPPPTGTIATFKLHPKKPSVPVHPPRGKFLAEAQGASMSTTTYNSYVNAGGTMPVTTEITNSGDLQQTVSPELSIPMPLDNPPLSSGAVPMQSAFSGMSNSVGVRPTVDMQFAPSTLYRQQHHMFDDTETKVEFLLGKRCILGRFSWSTAQDDTTLLASIDLNSAFSLEEGTGIPLNVAILNQFFFWKANVEIGVMAIKTQFHVGRLQAVIEYASPGVTAGSRTACYSDIMNFNADESHHSTIINWNAQTEFLRTFEGSDSVDAVQNYSLGTLNIYVLNRLSAPDTVNPEIDCLLTIRFREPIVSEIRPYPTMTWNDYLNINTSAGLVRFSRDTSFTTSDFVYITPTLVDLQVNFGGLDYVENGTYNVWMNVLIGVITISGIEYNVVFAPSAETRMVVTDSQTSLTHMQSGSNVSTGWRVVDDLSIAYNAETAFAQSGDTAEDEQPNVTETTSGEMDFVRKHPCETRIAEKFPFTITDIHEIGRRYIRMVPISNPDLDQFVLTSQVNATEISNVVHIPIQVQSPLRGLYAGWTGSVKYRIFTDADTVLSQVIINPFLNVGNKIGYTLVDPLPGSIFVGPNGEAFTGSSSITGANPREVMYPVYPRNWIDISVPFHTHFNFLMNSKTLNSIPVSVGTLSVVFGGTNPPTFMTAFGDDLRLGIFRVPRLTRFNFNQFPPGASGINSGRVASLNGVAEQPGHQLYTVFDTEEEIVIHPFTAINYEQVPATRRRMSFSY